MKKTRLHKYFFGEEGIVAVEFAIVGVLFLTVVLGTVETGRVLWAKNAVQNAMQDATRYVLVNSTLTDQEVTDYARASMSALYSDSSALTVTVDRTTEGGVNYVRVSGVYVYNNIVPFLPDNWNTINLQASSSTTIPSDAASPPPGVAADAAAQVAADAAAVANAAAQAAANAAAQAASDAAAAAAAAQAASDAAAANAAAQAAADAAAAAAAATPELVCDAAGNNCRPACPIGHSWSEKKQTCK